VTAGVPLLNKMNSPGKQVPRGQIDVLVLQSATLQRVSILLRLVTPHLVTVLEAFQLLDAFFK